MSAQTLILGTGFLLIKDLGHDLNEIVSIVVAEPCGSGTNDNDQNTNTGNEER